MVPYEAIFKRKSVRRFLMDALTEKQIADIVAYEKNLMAQEPAILTKMEIIDNTKGDISLHGMFSVKAPYYLVIYSEEKEGWLSNAGCLLEQMVLYMTTKGIGSVYLGNVKYEKNVIDHMKYVIMIAFGKTKEEVCRPSWKAKRLPLSSLLTEKEEMNPNFATMLEAARMAPSAYNRQPWYFEVFQKKIRIYYKKKSKMDKLSQMDEISMGIMLAHLLIAADELWVDIILHRPEQIPKGKMVYYLTLSQKND